MIGQAQVSSIYTVFFCVVVCENYVWHRHTDIPTDQAGTPNSAQQNLLLTQNSLFHIFLLVVIKSPHDREHVKPLLKVSLGLFYRYNPPWLHVHVHIPEPDTRYKISETIQFTLAITNFWWGNRQDLLLGPSDESFRKVESLQNTRG